VSSAQGFCFTACVLLVVLVASLTQLAPARILPGWMRAERTSVNTLWPQGWNFFTDEPTAEVTAVFAVDSSGRLTEVNQLQMAAGANWGLRRPDLVQMVEIGDVSGRLPAGDWRSCAGSTPSQCADTALRQPLAAAVNPVRNPTVCGHVLIAVQSPQRWTDDTRAWMRDWKIIRIANSEVTCAA
jgi:antimicrobial peptide system SdpA family protein